MRSATSYFNFTLLRKNFARFWPIWSLYGLFWLAVLPLNILSNRIHWDGGMARSLPLNYLDGGPSAAVALTALFGLLCAMAVFSYLYASRSVGMLHALPLRRDQLPVGASVPAAAQSGGVPAGPGGGGLCRHSGVQQPVHLAGGGEPVRALLLLLCRVLRHVHRPRAGPARLLCGSQWPGRRAVLGLQPYGRGISLRLHQRCLAGEAGRLAHPGAAALRGLSRPV